MTPRRERALFVAAVAGLWLLFFVQAVNAPVLLDDWFQLRYWRDHAFTPGAIWEYGYYNYFHYNPRIGDVLLAIIDGSRIVHLIVTPLVELAALVTAFVIAFGRWPRRTVADLQLLLFVQVMIWLVIPIPGMIYFYRPFATNYLWAFTLTLALFVPYRLVLAGGSIPRAMRVALVPSMLVLGWIAGMCNEHTGPAAMVAIAALVIVAWRRRALQAWMVSGLVGLYIGYPMLFLAPGQQVRYGGLATRDTPTKLLADRGISGCLKILWEFISESRLGLVLFAATVMHYVLTRVRRGEPIPRLPRETRVTTAVLAAASGAIVVTLFVSPTTTDRVFYASGVLLVAALAAWTERMFAEQGVRRLVASVCIALFAYHVVQFVAVYAAIKAENDDRIARLRSTPRGTVAELPSYAQPVRSRWHLGDDLMIYPWLSTYVAAQLFDLADVHIAGTPDRQAPSYRVSRTYDPPLTGADEVTLGAVPTYRQWQGDPVSRMRIAALTAPRAGHRLLRMELGIVDLPFDDPKHRRVVAVQWTSAGFAAVEGRPYSTPEGHYVRIEPASVPARLESTYLVGCGFTASAHPVIDGGAVLVRVDERYCRGPIVALLCEPDQCWLAGWF